MREITQVHYDLDGTHVNGHPDPAIAEEAARVKAEADANILEFQRRVDAFPNNNDKYADELELVRQSFAKDGFSIAPFIVLDPETYRSIFPNDSAGTHINGRLLLKDWEGDDPTGRRAEAYILNIALHEGAHSAGHTEDPFAISLESPLYEGGRTWGPSTGLSHSSFQKLHAHRGSHASTDGDCMEEGFADMVRILKLREMGRDVQFPTGVSSLDGPDLSMRLMTADLARKGQNRDGKPDIPIHYASVFEVEGNPRRLTALNLSGQIFAGYAMELLNERLSGELYTTMLEARKTPEKQRDVIRLINSVQPGLYHKLRSFGSESEDQVAFLQTVREALAASEQPVGATMSPLGV